ncbi:hypothetical protein SDC9_116453 [bioreactor metagenome]|uniref:Uncharacterized protein n=1 Tax=bioreactor metagenome TaxID=1076179 RepID=A0A645BWM5_9ZZZZ
MKLWAQFWHGGKAPQCFVRQQVGLYRAKANALNARHRSGLFHYFCQRRADVPPIAAQVDARKHDFAVSLRRKAVQLGQHIVQPAAAHPAAGLWDDAVGTGAIAAVLNF